ncbi:hypothetical protein MHP7448_0709 [Mesomycoplasma hyopneumoniae 7448]|uniref:Uncharacterized protein n=1 Tax=Mesomycoplasma hyopneumoniae (strain 7448) TaxID=262722 RepID=A4Q7X6_MESH7|nr:hypothetical protein MHP7448_0709 [Mesomycoplasma hyopneumoniae 7448]
MIKSSAESKTTLIRLESSLILSIVIPSIWALVAWVKNFFSFGSKFFEKKIVLVGFWLLSWSKLVILPKISKEAIVKCFSFSRFLANESILFPITWPTVESILEGLSSAKKLIFISFPLSKRLWSLNLTSKLEVLLPSTKVLIRATSGEEINQSFLSTRKERLPELFQILEIQNLAPPGISLRSRLAYTFDPWMISSTSFASPNW